MRDVLEAILTRIEGVDRGSLAEITRYTKLFWINTGPYNNLTARKFVLKDARGGIAARGDRRRNGAPLPVPPGETIAALVDAAAPMFFDPTFDPMVTNKTPGDGRDILAASANNLYDGVTMADLEGFERAVPAQLAAGEARRPARRGGLPRRRPIRREIRASSATSRTRRSASPPSRWRRRCGR